MSFDAKPRCVFCRPSEDNGNDPQFATTSIFNPAVGRPLPACQDCRDEWDEQEYNDWQAEQAYEREYA